MTKEDRELLVRIDERTGLLSTQFSNHLQHHFRYSILAWTVTLGALVTMVIALLKR